MHIKWVWTDPSVHSIPVIWRNQWKKSRKSHLSTTSCCQFRSWRRKPMFLESWERHWQSWRVSHSGLFHSPAPMQNVNKNTVGCNLKGTIAHQGADYWLSHSQCVKHSPSPRLCHISIHCLNVHEENHYFFYSYVRNRLCVTPFCADQFPGLQSKMRVVLRVEVEAVKFLKEEPHRLDALLKRCKTISDTLNAMRKYEPCESVLIFFVCPLKNSLLRQN